MITHDLDSLYAITDRVAVIADNKVVAVAPVQELERSDHPWIREYFLGPRGRAARAAAGLERTPDGKERQLRPGRALHPDPDHRAGGVHRLAGAPADQRRATTSTTSSSRGPVRGLTEGGEVHFNGIKVGEVTKIALDKTNPNNVIARARVTEDVPIRIDSYATLEPQGITGLNYVQITAGTSTRQLLKDYADRSANRLSSSCIPLLRSQRSAISDLLEGGGTVLTRTIEALDRVNRVLSDQNIKTFSAALSDTQAVTAELRERKSIVADAAERRAAGR